MAAGGISYFFSGLFRFTASLIRLVWVLLRLIIKGIRELARSAKESATEKKASHKKKTLSAEQRENIVKAILDDSLLTLDKTFDALVNEKEAIFSVPEALSCDYTEYEPQYGSRQWRAAWENALGERFDCECRYIDKGNYHLFGKSL